MKLHSEALNKGGRPKPKDGDDEDKPGNNGD